MSNIILYEPGDSVTIKQHGCELSEYVGGITKLKAILNWKAAVDLDIHAFYRTKNGKDGHVSFQHKGSAKKTPYIHLDKDAGVGNVAGDNQEIITIGSLKDIECILIATNIFRFFEGLAKDENFAKYDGRVRLVTNDNNKIVVPLTSNSPGRWCIIALIDSSDPYTPIVSNINKITNTEPCIDDYLDNDILEIAYDG